MSAVAAAEARVVRARLLAGEPITVLVGARLGAGGRLDLADASALVLAAPSDAKARGGIIAEFDRIIAAHEAAAAPEGDEECPR